MSGFIPFINKRRDFIKKSIGLGLAFFINPTKIFSSTKNEKSKMIQILKKTDQFNTTIFNGNFIVNKPVASGTLPNVKPYSSLFYWSHAIAIDDCEFGLHPHEGFEIMTFILDGNVTHYDTATKVWTPLETGDFQVIQSNSGIRHQERIKKGTRSFQIWFDPNFYKALQEKPSYVDYHSKDFQPKDENGLETITYVGQGNGASVLTPDLSIKKIILHPGTDHELALDRNSSYTFYVLQGSGTLNSNDLEENDAIRLSSSDKLSINFKNGGELFFIQTPLKTSYKAVWE